MIRTYKPNADLFFNKPYFLVKLVEQIKYNKKQPRKGLLMYIFKLTVVNHYFVAEINSLYNSPYIAS